MAADTISSLLQRLNVAMNGWADRLPFDQDDSDAMFEFDELVGDARLAVLMYLGAQRRDYLARCVDIALMRVKKAGVTFASECSKIEPPGNLDFWQGLTLDEIFSQTETVDGLNNASVDLLEAMYRCSKVFSAINDSVNQVDTLDGVHQTDSLTILPSRYSPGDLCRDFGISDSSLNTYAKTAKVPTPARGKRGQHYSLNDRYSICRYIVANVSDTQTVARAKAILSEIQTKPKEEK